MLKSNKTKLLISSILIILPIFIGLIFWNQLPANITTHWGFDGTADGWSSKPFAVFALPLFLFLLHWFCLFITFTDPKNAEQNKNIFSLIIWIVPIISLVTNGFIYLAAFNIHFSTQLFTSILTGFIFIVIGSYLPKCKQNYTIGIKIPWTLNDENNWNATHKFCGKVWIIGGILILICGFLPQQIFFWVLFGLILLITMIPFIYSYMYYTKHK